MPRKITFFDEDAIFQAVIPEGILGRLWVCWQAMRGNIASIVLIVPGKVWRKSDAEILKTTKGRKK